MSKDKAPATAKKPIYKQWWFWAIIVLVLAVIGGATQTNDEQNASEDKPAEISDETPETPKDEPTADNATTDQTETTSSSENTGGYKVGETMTFKDRKVTVTSVERNFSTGNEFVTPEDGKEFVKVNITIVNTSTSKTTVYAGDWKIQDGNGVIDGYDVLATSVAKSALGTSVELAGGGQVSGALVFEVPKGDTNLELQYKASFLNTVVIKL